MRHETIYRVTTEGDVEGRSTKTLGYARGEKNDIEEYYLPQKSYNLSIEPITIVDINHSTIQRRKALLQQKNILKDELERVENQLKNL